MARPLHELSTEDARREASDHDVTVTRNTARAFAAALSALLIATLVVSRSSDALTSDGTVAASAVSSGTVSLVDDDEGRSLFDLSDVAPGRPEIRCLEVVYEGTILPVDLDLRVEATGDLAPYLDVVIDEGTGGGFDSCDGFVSDAAPVYQGTLADLAASEWQLLGSMVNTGQRRSYRVAFELQDRQEALGLATNADFTWRVTPS